MAHVPANPKIYHITHVNNLSAIVQAGRIWSDTERIRQDVDVSLVGLSDIKQARLNRPVTCCPGTTVGQYVPFYFCPRSVMLYILHMGNYPGLTCRGGQGPIVHLVADMTAVITWAEEGGRPWAFTDVNARAGYARFFRDAADLGEVDWAAVESDDFRPPAVKEGKQAEFLVHELFPWALVERIGVRDKHVAGQVRAALREAGHKPLVCVEPGWYY